MYQSKGIRKFMDCLNFLTRLILILTLALAVNFISNKVEADEPTTGTLSVVVSSPIPGASPQIDFGSVKKGRSVGSTSDLPLLYVDCCSDVSTSWSLQIKTNADLASLEGNVLPPGSLQAAGVLALTTGTGSLIETFAPITSEPQTIYVSTPGEGATGTRIALKWDVSVPPRQPAGRYSTGIIFIITSD